MFKQIILRAIQFFTKYGLTFLIPVLFGFFFSSKDVGIYSYLSGVIALGTLFTDFGNSTAVINLLNNTSDTASRSKILSNALAISFIFSLVLSLGFLQIYFQYGSIYILIVLTIILSAFASTFDSILRVQEKYSKLTIISIASFLIATVVLFVCMKFFGTYAGIASLLSYFLSLCVFTFKDILTAFPLVKPSLAEGWALIKKSSVFGIISIAFFLYNRAETLLFGHFDYYSVLGHYEIAFKYITLCSIPYHIVAQVIAPKVSQYWHAQKLEKVQDLYSKTLLFVIPSSFILGFLFTFLTPYLIKLYPGFDGKILATIFFNLNIVFIFQRIIDFYGTGFYAHTNFEKQNLYVILLSGVVNIVTCYLLLSKHTPLEFFSAKVAIIPITSFLLFALYSYFLSTFTSFNKKEKWNKT